MEFCVSGYGIRDPRFEIPIIFGARGAPSSFLCRSSFRAASLLISESS